MRQGEGSGPYSPAAALPNLRLREPPARSFGHALRENRPRRSTRLDAPTDARGTPQGCRIKGDRTAKDRAEQCCHGYTVRGGGWLWCCNCAAERASRPPLGMRWQDAGFQRPDGAGTEVEHSSLATALSRRKTQFSEFEFRHMFESEKSQRAWLESMDTDTFIKVPAGLRWTSAGNRRPVQGRELFSEPLSRALKNKREFTMQEWADFGIEDLRSSDFIVSGAACFKPADAGDRFFTPVDDMQACQHCAARSKAHQRGKPCLSHACSRCKGPNRGTNQGGVGTADRATSDQQRLLQSLATEDLEEELARRREDGSRHEGAAGSSPLSKLRGAAHKISAVNALAGLARKGSHTG